MKDKTMKMLFAALISCTVIFAHTADEQLPLGDGPLIQELPKDATPFEEVKVIRGAGATLSLKTIGFKAEIGGKKQLVGPWRVEMSDGTPYQTGFYDKEGRQTGTWTSYHPNAKPALVSNFLVGLAHGAVIAYDEQGHLVSMSWNSKGVMVGISVQLTPDGKVVTAERYKDGKVVETMKGE